VKPERVTIRLKRDETRLYVVNSSKNLLAIYASSFTSVKRLIWHRVGSVELLRKTYRIHARVLREAGRVMRAGAGRARIELGAGRARDKKFSVRVT